MITLFFLFVTQEVHFFDHDQRYKQGQKGVEFYARRYQHCDDDEETDYIMDATPGEPAHCRNSAIFLLTYF